MLYPVIMAGGSGTRFWPRSRRHKPKQLIQVIGTGTMLQQTVSRLLPDLPAESLLVITNVAQAEEARRQLPDLRPEQVVGEPCGRDTAACIGLAAMMLMRRDPEAVMLVLAADQVISPAEKFRRILAEGGRIASEQHALVAFGVPPTHPSEQYGYLRRGEPLQAPPDSPRAWRLAEFKEKPTRAQAEELLRTGEYYWNSGNFAWRAADILQEIRAHLPALHDGLMRLQPALGTPEQDEALARVYPTLPAISIDYGVMEKARNAVLVEMDLDWDDVGSWNALARHQPADRYGNVATTRHAAIDTHDTIVAAEDGHLVATIGVRDLIVVHTADATLVCDRRRVSDVKALVELLRSQGLEAYL